MARRRLTQKQETFCLKYFELGNATEAALFAGYSQRTARFIASINLTKVNIQEKLSELNQKAEDASIAGVVERKKVLTEIIRGRFSEFMTNLTPDKLKSAALQEIKVTESGGRNRGRTTTIKLHNPIPAIDIINKMENIYESVSPISLIDQTLNIIVDSEEAAELLARVANGERT